VIRVRSPVSSSVRLLAALLVLLVSLGLHVRGTQRTPARSTTLAGQGLSDRAREGILRVRVPSFSQILRQNVRVALRLCLGMFTASALTIVQLWRVGEDTAAALRALEGAGFGRLASLGLLAPHGVVELAGFTLIAAAAFGWSWNLLAMIVLFLRRTVDIERPVGGRYTVEIAAGFLCLVLAALVESHISPRIAITQCSQIRRLDTSAFECVVRKQ
jgi:uncharacterized membrane protein SpoIIM required for sporulation